MVPKVEVKPRSSEFQNHPMSQPFASETFISRSVLSIKNTFSLPSIACQLAQVADWQTSHGCFQLMISFFDFRSDLDNEVKCIAGTMTRCLSFTRKDKDFQHLSYEVVLASTMSQEIVRLQDACLYQPLFVRSIPFFCLLQLIHAHFGPSH